MRTRNIKLNVFLNEDEKNILIEKSNKIKLTQSDFIRMLINNYMEESKLKKDIDNMFVTITKTIENLTQLQTKMERLNYFIIAEFLDKIINDLKSLNK